MKNNKTIRYLLVGAVLAVWVIIGFKIGGTLFPGNVEEIFYSPVVAIRQNDTVRMDYELSLKYKDPFFKNWFTEASVEKVPVIERRIPKNTTPTIRRPVQWPAIKYYGLVTNQKSQATKVSLSINDKYTILKQAEEFYNIKLLQIFSDSILLEYKADTTVIMLEK